MNVISVFVRFQTLKGLVHEEYSHNILNKKRTRQLIWETETSTSFYVDSHKGVDPGAEPEYLHEILTDDVSGYGWGSNSAQENVERALSRVKVCQPEAVAVENRLRSEYFSKWDETCEVIEATEISVHNLTDLVSRLEHQYRGVNFNIRKKIQGIHWAPSWSHKVFEFTFGDNIDSGEVYFGIICLAKSPDSQTFDAVSSLYKLNFSLRLFRFLVLYR